MCFFCLGRCAFLILLLLFGGCSGSFSAAVLGKCAFLISLLFCGGCSGKVFFVGVDVLF